MVMDAIVERFVEQTPITVMARLALQRALEPAWVDAVFEKHRQYQYQGELLFSTTVELMSAVAVGLRPSLHAAFQAAPGIPVSVQALYDKVRRTDPKLVRELVRGSAERLSPVVEAMHGAPLPTLKGYRVRIIDGNHLPASEKRLKPLRAFRGAALPGQSLVVYDPATEIVTDIVPCEDGHANERSLMGPLLRQAQAGELWIADRNFSTREILAGWHERGCGFIVREHGCSPHPQETGPLSRAGHIAAGMVQEQAVTIDSGAGQAIALRRIEVHLDAPTEDGDTVIRLLTNLPAAQFNGRKVARLYRRRWSIESLFQRLESVLQSEMITLGHPRAALLAFGVAVLAWNVLAVLQEAIKARHDLTAAGIELSPYYLAMEIKAQYAGMMTAIAAAAWQAHDVLTPAQLGGTLLDIAAQVEPHRLRKHPRGPKKPKARPYASHAEVARHVSTARVLHEGKIYE
jgi:IS4 transposase